MKMGAKVVLSISVLFLLSIVYYQFVFNPTVEPLKSQQAFTHPEFATSDTGTVIGSNKSKLNIIIYTDYGCGACKMLHRELFALEEELKYIKSGLIKVIYKDVPYHPNAEQAALAAMAAGKQGKFVEMSNLLFEKEEEWSRSSKQSIFYSYASTLGLDINKFSKDMTSSEAKQKIEESINEFKQLESLGTPILIIGDIQLNGALDKESINQVIQDQLKAKEIRLSKNGK
jgi:protein-disulfide isomerase